MTDLVLLPETLMECLLVAQALESINHCKSESMGTLSFPSLAHSVICLSVRRYLGNGCMSISYWFSFLHCVSLGF